MASPGLPTYSSAASRPELEELNRSNYFSATANTQLASTYDEEAAQPKGSPKQQTGGGILKKQASSLEKVEFAEDTLGGGVRERPINPNRASYSGLHIASPPDNTNVVLDHGMQKTKVR